MIVKRFCCVFFVCFSPSPILPLPLSYPSPPSLPLSLPLSSPPLSPSLSSSLALLKVQKVKGIMKTVSIPVMAKCRIGHFAEAQILQSLEVDFIDESEGKLLSCEFFFTPIVSPARFSVSVLGTCVA